MPRKRIPYYRMIFEIDEAPDKFYKPKWACNDFESLVTHDIIFCIECKKNFKVLLDKDREAADTEWANMQLDNAPLP